MELERDWKTIKHAFACGITSSKHVAIGSVDQFGQPHVTPIGFCFLRDTPAAFYFDQYPQVLSRNIECNRRVCLMSVQSGNFFWMRALQQCRFPSLPGIRLHGEVDDPREATAEELQLLARRIGWARHLPGAKLIWSGLHTVRDIKVTSVFPVTYPRMMEHLVSANGS